MEMQNAIIMPENKQNEKDDFLIGFLKMFKSKKKDHLLRISKQIVPLENFQQFKNKFQELNNDKYEHLEQTEEFEEVEIERIEEAEKILNDNYKSKELQEYLSFLKAGVPMSMRPKFYQQFFSLDFFKNKD